jgi:hypothetical protein
MPTHDEPHPTDKADEVDRGESTVRSRPELQSHKRRAASLVHHVSLPEEETDDEENAKDQHGDDVYTTANQPQHPRRISYSVIERLWKTGEATVGRQCLYSHPVLQPLGAFCPSEITNMSNTRPTVTSTAPGQSRRGSTTLRVARQDKEGSDGHNEADACHDAEDGAPGVAGSDGSVRVR